jgi:hypothetical protein
VKTISVRARSRLSHINRAGVLRRRFPGKRWPACRKETGCAFVLNAREALPLINTDYTDQKALSKNQAKNSAVTCALLPVPFF